MIKLTFESASLLAPSDNPPQEGREPECARRCTFCLLTLVPLFLFISPLLTLWERSVKTPAWASRLTDCWVAELSPQDKIGIFITGGEVHDAPALHSGLQHEDTLKG